MQTDEQSQEKTEAGYALFDLDQTLIPWDTQLLFCNWITRRHPVRRLFLLVFLPFLPFAKVLGAGGMKRVFVAYLFGMTVEEREAEARAFAQWVMKNHTYPNMLECVQKEIAAGRRVILTSASPELYVTEIGKILGVDESYGTRFVFGEKVPLFPDLVDENNKGEAKVRRMLAEGAIPVVTPLPQSRAYSDSKADLPILELCEEGVLVNPNEALAERGKEMGWEIERPVRPTKGKFHFGLVCVQQMFGLYPTEPNS